MEADMKTKIYIYGVIALLIISLAAWGSYTHKQLQEARAENDRYKYNQQQLLDQVNEYKRITVRKNELIQSLTREQDSLITALRIKPKYIDRIVERVHFTEDTTRIKKLLATGDSLRKVIVQNLARQYPFVDQSDCFLFEGAVTIDQGLNLEVTRREYLNRTTEIAYIERSKRFLFIRYGPWRGKLYVQNECGEDQIKELTVIR